MLSLGYRCKGTFYFLMLSSIFPLFSLIYRYFSLFFYAFPSFLKLLSLLSGLNFHFPTLVVAMCHFSHDCHFLRTTSHGYVIITSSLLYASLIIMSLLCQYYSISRSARH